MESLDLDDGLVALLDEEITKSEESVRQREQSLQAHSEGEIVEVVTEVAARAEAIIVSTEKTRYHSTERDPKKDNEKDKSGIKKKSSKTRSRSRSRSHSSRSTYSRSPPRRKRKRSTSSSSRGTYDGFEVILNEDECPYACRDCHRGFYTIKELAEHEIRIHESKIPCSNCDKRQPNVAELAIHLQKKHGSLPVICCFCEESFGKTANGTDKAHWEDYRAHVYRELLRKRINEHASRVSGVDKNAVALRGMGKCPHGRAVKCKNFPDCPGAKCIYSHGQCRYDITCNKASCPFDHANRPRTCMACLNNLKGSSSSKRRY